MYAAGKIPGGFFKREGRATERATLTARMIDRPIRPLWPKGFKNEVQVICTVLSADLVTPHDILCINGASARARNLVTPVPRPGRRRSHRAIEGELVVNPTLQQQAESTLDLIVVGTRDALTMVEAGADEIPEAVILAALELAHARDSKDLRRDRRSSLAGRQAEVDRRRARRGTRRSAWGSDRSGNRRARPARGAVRCRRDRGRDPARGDDGVDRGRHGARAPAAQRTRVDPREEASRGGRGAGAGAVRVCAARADGRRAGLEGAEVAEARHPLHAHPRRRRAAVPGRLRAPRASRRSRTRSPSST